MAVGWRGFQPFAFAAIAQGPRQAVGEILRKMPLPETNSLAPVRLPLMLCASASNGALAGLDAFLPSQKMMREAAGTAFSKIVSSDWRAPTSSMAKESAGCPQQFQRAIAASVNTGSVPHARRIS